MKLINHAPLIFRGAWIFLTLFYFSNTSWAQNPVKGLDLASADSAYQKGDCGLAISLYQKVSEHPNASADEKAMSDFRIAYCHYSLGESEQAEKRFKKYLKVYPKDEEARLRYAESLFRQGKWAQVVQSTSNSKTSWSKGEVELLKGRSLLEMKNPDSAISHFTQAQSNPNLAPQIYYWWAVAEYQRGNKMAARDRFERAITTQGAAEWIQNYSKDWIRQIDQDLKSFRGALVFGINYDGNLSYSSTQSVSAITGQPATLTAAPATYIKDESVSAALRLHGVITEAHPWTLSWYSDLSVPFYLNHSSYNNQTFDAGVNIQFNKSAKLKYSFDLHGLDSRYNYQVYQESVAINPGLTWLPDSSLAIYLNVPYTMSIAGRDAKTLSPYLSARYQLLSNVSLNLGASYSNTSATAAVYTATSPAYVSTGVQFGNYQTYGGSLGLGIQLPKGFYLTVGSNYYRTTYAREAAQSTSLAARADSSFGYSADLYFDVSTDKLSFDLGYSKTSNQSTGFQGIAYSTTMSTYNYDRPFVYFNTILGF
jgi:tetratricopeptide (TPR) repeat protein